MSKEPLLWETFRDAKGRTWRVWIAAQCDELDGNMGMTFFDTRQVYVYAGQSKEELADTYLHEMAHVAMNGKDHNRMFEENAIALVVPNILPTLRRSGWRMPALPDGYEALRRAAKKEEKSDNEARRRAHGRRAKRARS